MARIHYDRDARIEDISGEDGGHPRLRKPGTRPRPEPPRQRRRRRRRPPRREPLARQGRGRAGSRSLTPREAPSGPT